MGEECLICGAALEYLQRDEEMECAVCHRRQESRTRCVNGHYVCSACHMKGLDSILALCLRSGSRDPAKILEEMMSLPFCHMHGPEHHVMVGAALLTAYRNAGGALDLPAALSEVVSRGSAVPGGACGFWGACGAGISTGMYLSIVTGATPLSRQAWGLANQMTARALAAIGTHGGPRLLFPSHSRYVQRPSAASGRIPMRSDAAGQHRSACKARRALNRHKLERRAKYVRLPGRERAKRRARSALPQSPHGWGMQ